MSGEAIEVTIEGDDVSPQVDPVTGAMTIPTDDGGVVVQLDDHRPKAADRGARFDENLALDMDEHALSLLANELYEAISADDVSRQGTLENIKRGLELLGLQLTEPRSSVGDSSAPVEGMSSVTNPLLLENILKGWANTVGELLPANGPVKIREDGEESVAEDDLAEALERDMNHWFTKVATEFYPDTSHMILWGPYFSGCGFKKVYRCAMRRRAVSETVDLKDFIVSDTTKDLASCERVTHQIEMRQSTMKRMMHLGAYRDVTLVQPTGYTSVVDNAIAMIQGVNPSKSRPADQPHLLWETQCLLDLGKHDNKVPNDLKDEGIPLPYLVTMDKDTREILAIRRDWEEDDDDAERKKLYVKYPYIPGPGFYGTGMLNSLGNSSAALTAIERICIDTGMFANFPGGVISKDSSKQNTSDIRVAPGEFQPVETQGKDIRTMVMALPYKDISSGILALWDKIAAQAEKTGGAAEVPSGEGLANVPVGTMLAQIEQTTKVMLAAHHGMHGAMSEEFELVFKILRDHPEDWIRAQRKNKKCPPNYWNEQRFLRALNDCDLVPVSDPNVPSHIHRIAKAIALTQLIIIQPLGTRLDPKAVLLRCLRALREDPQGLIMDPPPASAAPDPAQIIAGAKVTEANAKAQKAQSDSTVAQAKVAQLPQDQNLEAQKLQTQRDVAAADLNKEMVIHGADQVKAAHDIAMDRSAHQLDAVRTTADIANQHREHSLATAAHGLAVQQHQHEAGMDVAEHALNVHQAMNPPEPREKPE